MTTATALVVEDVRAQKVLGDILRYYGGQGVYALATDPRAVQNAVTMAGNVARNVRQIPRAAREVYRRFTYPRQLRLSNAQRLRLAELRLADPTRLSRENRRTLRTLNRLDSRLRRLARNRARESLARSKDGQTWVPGYYRNGTWVQGYYRSASSNAAV